MTFTVTSNNSNFSASWNIFFSFFFSFFLKSQNSLRRTAHKQTPNITRCKLKRPQVYIPSYCITINSISLTLSGLKLDFSGYASYMTNKRNFMVRLMQLKSPFQRSWLVCFHSNTGSLTTYNILLYSLHTHRIWKSSVEKYPKYGTLSKTTHFLRAFCEVVVLQKCTEPQAGMVQNGLIKQPDIN